MVLTENKVVEDHEDNLLLFEKELKEENFYVYNIDQDYKFVLIHQIDFLYVVDMVKLMKDDRRRVQDNFVQENIQLKQHHVDRY
jgi:hypothetical protein